MSAVPAFIFWPFHVIRDYARTIAAGRQPVHRQAVRICSICPTSSKRRRFPLPIIFGHHDLLPANFLDDGARLWLIDYEYAGFGTAMFDLAGAASNAGMDGTETEALLVGLSRPSARSRLPPRLRRHAMRQPVCARRCGPWSRDLHLAAPGVDYRAYAAENLERLDAAVSHFTAQHGTP